MGIIRLVILAVLAYVAWLLIRGIAGKSRSRNRSGQAAAAGKKKPAQDVLVEDPVCHTLVPKHQAIRLRKNGTTYYFCSDKCCDKFSESGRGEQ